MHLTCETTWNLFRYMHKSQSQISASQMLEQLMRRARRFNSLNLTSGVWLVRRELCVVFLWACWAVSLLSDHRRVFAKLPGGLLSGPAAHSASQLLSGHHASHHGGRHRRAERQRILCVHPAGQTRRSPWKHPPLGGSNLHLSPPVLRRSSSASAWCSTSCTGPRWSSTPPSPPARWSSSRLTWTAPPPTTASPTAARGRRRAAGTASTWCEGRSARTGEARRRV